MKNRKGKPYCVSFDARESPGVIMGVCVELSKVIVGSADTVRVDLADHPLYYHIWDYCRNNLPRGKK